MPPSNSKPSTQFAARVDADGTPESKSGRRKPAKDADQVPKNVRFAQFESRAYEMSYACLLIPRDPEHLLSGKVADFIAKSIQNVCIAFGWHLMQVQVQPEYFQWVVSAKVGTPPSKCINMIREETSKGILAAFRQLHPPDSYSGFWAPGYLVRVGDEPHPPSIIQEFIKLTRQQQGLSHRSQGGKSPEHGNNGA